MGLDLIKKSGRSVLGGADSSALIIPYKQLCFSTSLTHEVKNKKPFPAYTLHLIGLFDCVKMHVAQWITMLSQCEF